MSEQLSHFSYSSLPAVASAKVFLPERLEGLRRLAFNLYWCWHPRAISLFKRIDAHTWQVARNPIPVLAARTDWTELLDNPEFMAEYQTVIEQFDKYMADGSTHWFAEQQQKGRTDALKDPIVYFCAEFGLHEHLQIYSGGLGILAGDHVKTASDLGLPFVAVGLLYRQGYFRQTIDAEGLQEHAYPHLEPEHMPIARVTDPKTGRPLTVKVEFPGRAVNVAVWVARVGRVPLLLLDTDTPENAYADRPITGQLYVRGREMRLHQEIVLGVGGVRALRALEINPGVVHLNEGHSAFLLVEMLREKARVGVPFDTAIDEVRKRAVFTIHTPVSAGNEKFDANLVRRLTHAVIENSSIDIERIIELGRGEHADPNVFDMTAFSLRMANISNAVSQLHAATANATWKHIMSGREILGVTNGVHMGTWLGQSLRWMCDDNNISLEDLVKEHKAGRLKEHIDTIDAKKLWEGHQRQKLELFYFLRGRLRRMLARQGESPESLGDLDKIFDPNALTIGFARRFATYKRAHLLFTDEDRLARLLFNSDRPVQVVFAGKAHPADRPGQKVIQTLFQKSRSDRFKGRIFVIEDYDMRVGRFLVDGVDVWLNNPRRPLEASGTSGMKAAANGVPNLSILDGWWDEGYDGHNGWVIGGREQNPDEGAQDYADSQSLYAALEQQVVPLYYQRDHQGLPMGFIEKMRAAMGSSMWRFSTHRMLEEYFERMYIETARASLR